MILFDLLMRGPDSYWKRRWHAEEIRRHRAEADAGYYRGSLESAQEKLDTLSERDLMQARAIDGFNRELSALQGELREARNQLLAREREIDTLKEALRAERDARSALKTSTRLWEAVKGEALRGAAEAPESA